MIQEMWLASIGIVYLFLVIKIYFCMSQFYMDRSVGIFESEGKIVGGSVVPIEKYPFTVQIFNHGSLCAGTVLSSWAILTAAHCFGNHKEIKDIHVRLGARYLYDSSAQSHDIWYFVEHEDYNKQVPFACDIALIFTRRPIEFTERTKRAILVNSNNWMHEKETDFKAAGWGFTSYRGSLSKEGLKEAHLRLVPAEDCAKMNLGAALTEDMFCLYGDGVRDTCQGDSGGGIMWNGPHPVYCHSKQSYCSSSFYVHFAAGFTNDCEHPVDVEGTTWPQVVGLVSHGEGCAQVGKAGIYTNVYYFLSWIEKKMKEARIEYCRRPPP